MKTGLVLEGGAMRGMFTAGVLDVLMEHGIVLDGAIGVSAGAVFGCNYKSHQIGRVIRYNTQYCNDKRYASFGNLLRTGNLYSEQFCYHDIPEKLDPLDYDAFLANPTKLYVGCSNLDTGEAEYLECTDMRKPEDVNKVRASASLPLVSNIVEVDGMKLLDGGVSDSIPIFAFRRMGYRRNIVVLTRPEGYRKGPDKMLRLEAGRYREYPEFVKRCHMRHMYYNKTLDKLEELEKEGDTLIIRPSETIEISRLEKKPEMIEAMYELGVYDAKEKLQQVKKFLRESKEESRDYTHGQAQQQTAVTQQTR